MKGLAAASLPSFPTPQLPAPYKPEEPMPPAQASVSLQGVFRHLDTVLHEKTLVIADVGESLFASVDLHVHRRFEFLSPAYYTSMGFAVPAAIGAGFADPSLRPIVLVGVGAFQMTGSELSTAVRYKQAPVVIVLNNHGYSTEREIGPDPGQGTGRSQPAPCHQCVARSGRPLAGHDAAGAATGEAALDRPPLTPARSTILLLLRPSDRRAWHPTSGHLFHADTVRSCSRRTH